MNEVSRGAIARDRDIPDKGQPEQCLDVWVVRLRLQRIGAHLLIAAQRAAAQAGHWQAELAVEQLAGSPRR